MIFVQKCEHLKTSRQPELELNSRDRTLCSRWLLSAANERARLHWLARAPATESVIYVVDDDRDLRESGSRHARGRRHLVESYQDVAKRS